MRDRQDAIYLQAVLERWRAAFADAEGEHISELYAAGATRGTEDDWVHLRPLLRVLRVMLTTTSTFVDQIGYGLERSIEPTADAETARELHELASRLRAAMGPLVAVLQATNPDPDIPEGPGAGRPRRPVRVIAPEQGGLRGLLDIPAMAGVGLMIGVGTSIGATVQTARAWWRATWPPQAPPARRDERGT